MMHPSPQRTQSGSAFFLILIGIALFAALSYAVIRGGSGSEAMLTKEQARVSAQELMAYGDTIRKAVQKLRLSGCDETQLSFVPAGHNTANPLAPSDKSCHVFDPAGGNVNFIPPTQWESGTGTYHDWWINGQSAIQNVGSTAPELVLWGLSLKAEVCKAIRDITNTPEFYESVGNHTTAFNGTYNLVANGIGDDANSPLAGVTEMCPNNNYILVLIAR